MPEIGQHFGPVVGAAAGLHAHKTRRQIGEERGDRVAAQRLAQNDLLLSINAMNLVDVLRQVETNPNDLHELLLLRSRRSKAPLRWRRGPYHWLPIIITHVCPCILSRQPGAPRFFA